MRTILALMFAVVGLAIFALSAEAGTFTKVSNEVVKYEGKVLRGDSDKLARYIEANPETKYVRMNSEGGAAIEGYVLGYKINELGLHTVVASDEFCFSACAVAFLGGDIKIITGLLGFHVAWTTDNVDTNEAMKQGQFFGAIDASYMFNMGYTNQLNIIVAQVTAYDTFLLVDDLTMFEMTDNQFTTYAPLPEGWIGEHLAGPIRLHMLMRGY